VDDDRLARVGALTLSSSRGFMKAIAVVAVITLAVANSACTTTGKRVGGAAVGGVFGAVVAGPIGAAAGAAAGAATAPAFVR
jgi:osmotically inducible lipoprotein OsmB